ncbi:MAG: hypothetical protein J0L54_16820 [Chitinophagales bacterium]|nr:hypothetical protein [Chitinophagales bacterium]
MGKNGNFKLLTSKGIASWADVQSLTPTAPMLERYRQPYQATVPYLTDDKIFQQPIAHFGTFASTQTLTQSQLAKEPKFSQHRNLQLDTSPIFATVKLFTFIFSFYILFLSTVPCCAVDNCNDDVQQSQTSDRHEHNDGCKNCSPFTLCGNCAGFTFIANSLQVDTPQQFTQQTFSGYIQSYLPQYVSSFWQPPRLG